MNESQWIGVRSPEFRAISERIKVATRLSSKLSGYCWDEPDPIRAVFEELIGKSVGDSFHLIPPFHADYGLNITIGRAVFIGYECMFTGHGAIDIAEEVMIANKVNLVTAGRAGQAPGIHHRGADHHREERVDRPGGHGPARGDHRR
jgi:acetyltransferase-like isoleucine patch superfamily enzyme